MTVTHPDNCGCPVDNRIGPNFGKLLCQRSDGTWYTRYYAGTSNPSCWSTVRTARHTHQQRVWMSPLEPLDKPEASDA